MRSNVRCPCDLRLPNLPRCEPNSVGLDPETLEQHSAANARQIEIGAVRHSELLLALRLHAGRGGMCPEEE